MGPAPADQGQALPPIPPLLSTAATITPIWRCWTKKKSQFPHADRTARTTFWLGLGLGPRGFDDHAPVLCELLPRVLAQRLSYPILPVIASIASSLAQYC